jgi:hypothetical protein
MHAFNGSQLSLRPTLPAFLGRRVGGGRVAVQQVATRKKTIQTVTDDATMMLCLFRKPCCIDGRRAV